MSMSTLPTSRLSPTHGGSRRFTPPRSSVHSSLSSSQLRHSASSDGLHMLLEAEWKDVRYVLEGREKNKKQFQLLNEKLASHIEKTRFLGAENKKVHDELRNLKLHWIEENEKTRKIYEDRFNQWRVAAENAERRLMEKEIVLQQVDADLLECRARLQEEGGKHNKLLAKLDSLNKELAQKDGELSQMRRRIDSMEEESVMRQKAHSVNSKPKNDQMQADLDHYHISYQALQKKHDGLLEEIEFLRHSHDQEIKELRAVANSSINSEVNREYWHNELSLAVREIQQVYEKRYEHERQEMEEKLMQKMNEMGSTRMINKSEVTRLEEENKRLKFSLEDMRRRLIEAQNELTTSKELMKSEREALEMELRQLHGENMELKRSVECLEADMNKTLADLSALTDAKLNIEAEVETFRRLLEVENSSQYIHAQHSNKTSTNKVIEAEVTARSQFDKSFIGPLYIEECATDGRYIEIGNNGNKTESLLNWRIVRNIDHDKHIVRFTFSEGIVEPGQFIRIWARGRKPSQSNIYDIECPYTNWGNGNHVDSVLYDAEGVERARHTQRTSYLK